jgi:hypothetical protein
VGTVAVAANQAGNTTYSAAPQVNASIVVGQAAQTITFNPPPSPVTYGMGPITLSATASSGLPVSFSVVSGPASVNGNSLAILGTGTIVVAANQSGNINYSAAQAVTLTLMVSAAPDFSLSSGVTSVPLNSGSSATIPFTVSPSNGFNQQISFSCSIPSVAVACTFNPPILTPTPGTTSAQVTVQYPANTAQMTSPKRKYNSSGTLLCALGLFVSGLGFRGRRGLRQFNYIRLGLLLLMSLSVITCLSGCGRNRIVSTTTQALTITAVSGTITHTVSIDLVVTNIR